MHNKLITLGIETSCDETAISIYNNKDGILSEYVYSQTSHTKYGGTVPELASRDHVKKILNLMIFTLKKANINICEINGLAYTKGPGLSGSLLIGSSFGKALGLSLSIPTIGVNHLEAHILTSFIFNKNIEFPCLIILISGAHTMLLKMNNYKNLILFGGTLDDGAGETFDKIARSLNLSPLNGKSIERISSQHFDFNNLKLPQSFYKSKCYNFSFSGLKTRILNIINNSIINTDVKANIAYNFQNTIIKTLINKSKYILKNHLIKSILLAGGVSSNKELRLAFSNFTLSLNIKVYFAPLKYCTDNGTMIAFLGFVKLLENAVDKNISIKILSQTNF